MEQNKVRTYLLYAVGEIALVMIGILLALQVNNWNEQRKQTDLKDQYLISLKKDFHLDVDHFSEQIEGLENQLSKIDSIETYLSNPSTTVLDYNVTIIKGLSSLGLIENANLNTSTFQALQNSGRIDLLDEKTQDALISLNVIQQRYQAYIKENLEWKTHMFNKYANEVPILWGRKDIALNETLNSALREDIEWSKARRSYYNFLNIGRVTNTASLLLTRELKSETEALLSQIGDN